MLVTASASKTDVSASSTTLAYHDNNDDDWRPRRELNSPQPLDRRPCSPEHHWGKIGAGIRTRTGFFSLEG